MPRGFILHFTANGPNAIEPQEFGGLPIRIGRNALNDCKLPFQFVSDFHARIAEEGGRICVQDLNSRNGVFVRAPSGATRIPGATPVELAPYENEFFLGPMRVVLEVVERREWQPERSFNGTVLGNRDMLEIGQPLLDDEQAPGSLPPLDGALPAAQRSAALPGAGHAFDDPLSAAVPAPTKETRHFDVSLEKLALAGLNELAASLVPGQPLRTQGDMARLITRLHDTVEVFCRCFIPLREGHSQFVSSLDLQRAASQRGKHRSPGYHRVESARTPEEVAFALLDFRDRSPDSVAAIEGIFADLMVHQLALLDGVMQGVRALLEELSPESIEQTVSQERPSIPLGFGRHKALWQEYLQRYEELAEEKQALLRIFGPEFAEAYREYKASKAP